MNSSSPWPLLWGTGIALGLGAPIAKAAAAAGVPPLAFALWPTLAAALLLATLGAWRAGRPPDAPRLARFGAVAGLFGHALPMSAVFWLSSNAGAGFASLPLALPPVFTLLFALAVGHERPARRRFAAVGLGLSGALLMLTGRGGSYEASALAVALALAIPASIGAANVYRALRLPPGVGGEWLSAATLLASAAAVGALAAATGQGAVPPAAAALGWLALQTAVLVTGYLLYFALQRRADPVTFSFIGYVMMLAGMAVGAVAFAERPSWTVAPALLLVLASLRLLARPAGGAALRVATPGRSA